MYWAKRDGGTCTRCVFRRRVRFSVRLARSGDAIYFGACAEGWRFSGKKRIITKQRLNLLPSLFLPSRRRSESRCKKNRMSHTYSHQSLLMAAGTLLVSTLTSSPSISSTWGSAPTTPKDMPTSMRRVPESAPSLSSSTLSSSIRGRSRQSIPLDVNRRYLLLTDAHTFAPIP